MSETQQLLAEFAQHHSESAFRELVNRYVDLVYSTALRMVNGDAALAQDVCQIVFIQLAANARKLAGSQAALGGWLHRCTRNAAHKILRTELRRQTRERQAVLMEPDPPKPHWDAALAHLDEAIDSLGNLDRAAIVQRFFERRDYAAIARETGGSEDAARMRVNRSLEKLRQILQRRGVPITASALAAALATDAVTAAPVGIAAAVSIHALAPPAASGALTWILTMMHAKTTLAGALILAGLTVSLVLQERSLNELRTRNAALREKSAQVRAQEMPEPRPASAPIVAVAPKSNLAQAQLLELLTLRNQAGLQRDELAKLRSQLAVRQRQADALERAAKLYYPKESWNATDSSTPESAVAAMLYLLSNHSDLNSLMANLPPDAQKKLQAQITNQPTAKLDAEISQEAKKLAKVDGIRIVRTVPASNDCVIVTYLQYSDHGSNDIWCQMSLRQTGNKWNVGQ